MRRALQLTATILGTTGLLLTAAIPAQAATNYSYTGSTKVSGNTVSFSSSIKSSTRTTAAKLGICIRDSKGTNLDLAAVNRGRTVTLSPRAYALVGKSTFQPGKYTYGVCFYKNGYWQGEPLSGRNARTFTVNATVKPSPTPTPTPTQPTPTPAPATGTMPTGNVTSNGINWAPVMSEDFTKNAGTNEVATKYQDTFPVYPDGSGDGKYLPGQVLTAHDSVLDFHMRHIGNVDAGAAGQFIQKNGDWAYTGGRFSVRFKATGNAAGYGSAFILWPESQNWGEGEIDFPEGELTSQTNLYQHNLGSNPGGTSLQVEGISNWSDWHTATVEWVPGKTLRYYMDGKLIAQETNPANIPTTMHSWVVQTGAMDGSSNGAPDSSDGHLLIDWAVAYKAQ
jgi:hypothetical protein